MKTYKQLYNEHQEYVTLRNREGVMYEKYINDVKYWKLKYLTKLLDNNNLTNSIKKTLEIGCATGELLNIFLQDEEIDKTGIDISDENIKYAKTYFSHINFLSIDYKEFFQSNKDFDVIILSDILEHVEDDLEMLKISGLNSKYVLLNMPIEKVLEYKDRIYGIDDIEGHLRAYSVKDTEDLIDKAGLKVVDFEVRNYVLEPVFKDYLLKKIIKNNESKTDAIEKFLHEVLDIEMNVNFYKKNYFGLLTKK